VSQIQINNWKNKVEAFLNFHFKILENLLVGKSFDELKIQFSKEFKKFNYISLTKTFSMLSYDEKGNLRGAYPISPKESLYKIDVEGIGSGYAMCAIDSLGVPYLFGKTTTITSQDPVSNQTVRFTIDPKLKNNDIISKVTEEFKELVITNPKDSAIQVGKAVDQAVDFCPYIGFVTNKKDLREEHIAIVDTLDFATALNYGKHAFSREKIIKNFEDFFFPILSIYQYGFLSGDHLVEQYIQNNELLLETYSQEQIKTMLINTLTKNGLIERDNNSNTEEVYTLTSFGKNLMSPFAE
jgi:hypothetical protein